MKAFLTAVAALALAASASGATLKVPQQYGTIQEAVNAAAEGDTIVVSKGVYLESVAVETPGLKILGKKAVMDGTFAGGLMVTVQGTSTANYDCIRVYSPDVTIQGFTFRNGSNHVSIYAPGCRVLKCTSRNAGNNGIYVGGTEGTEISGNRIVGAQYAGIYSVAMGSFGLVSKNTIQQTGERGIMANGFGGTIDGNRISMVAGGRGGGIYAGGSGIVVSGNTVSNTGGNGITLEGLDFTVTGNRVSWVSGDTGIYVNGDRSLIQGNTVTAATALITSYGSGSSILDNRVSIGLYGGWMTTSGFTIGGDDLTVTGNLAQQIAENGVGFYIYHYGSGGVTTIADNTAEDASGGGFNFNSIYNATVSGCRAIRCGSYPYTSGFAVNGSGSTFTDCSATDSHGTGFYVSASDNDFVTCTSTNSTINEYMVFGNGNTFTSCTGRGSGGQGFNNQGTNTVLDGGVYLDNRLDIANQVGNMAFFVGGLGSVLYDSGGETSEPGVYFVW